MVPADLRQRPIFLHPARRMCEARMGRVQGGQSLPKEEEMIVLGLVLLVVGFLLHISILWTLGIILLVVGAILAILGGTGRAVGGRAHWY
jgi:Family of unknown function (DUF6131)